MNKKSPRVATPREKDILITPSIIRIKKNIKNLKRHYRLTMTAGILVVAFFAALFVFYCQFGSGKSLLCLAPIVALFCVSITRLESQLNVCTYILGNVTAGQYMLREVRTDYNDAYGLIAYVFHPTSDEHLIQAFCGGCVDYKDPEYEGKCTAIRDVLRKYRNGTIISIEEFEGDAFDGYR